MKNVMFILVMVLALTWSQLSYGTIGDPEDGGGVPFPIGSEVPFPWDVFEGEWDLDGIDATYRFQIVSISEKGNRRVWVNKLNMDTGRVLAEGSASVRRNKRVLHARLQTKTGRRVAIRLASYNDKDERGCRQRVLSLQERTYNVKGREVSKDHHLLSKLQNLK